MRLGRRDPIHRAQVLKRERELQSSLFGQQSEEEVRDIARKLGLEDYLPDSQQPLPLKVCA